MSLSKVCISAATERALAAFPSRVDIVPTGAEEILGYFIPVNAQTPERAADEPVWPRIGSSAVPEFETIGGAARVYDHRGENQLGIFVPETDRDREAYAEFERRFSHEDFDAALADPEAARPLSEILSKLNAGIALPESEPAEAGS